MGTAKETPRTLSSPYQVEDAPQPAVPAQVGRYQISELIGTGAMGVVYRAHDPDLGRDVAIKLVRDGRAGGASYARLLREAQVMARLRHRNVVPIFDVGMVDGAVFVTMPLLAGGTLTRWLHEHVRSSEEILDRFDAAGRGLAAAHAAGLVHRDFKPDNVLLGDDAEVHVADFGLARRADEELDAHPGAPALAPGSLTQTGAAVGTLPYMAPEQLSARPIDARADQFSFCVALWEALYGTRPFPDPEPGAERLLRTRIETIAAGPIAPPVRDRLSWIVPLLRRGLAMDPDLRWPSLQNLLEAIAAQRKRPRPPRALIGLAAASATATVVVLAWPTGRVPQVGLMPLTHRRDLRAAAVSPDGSALALVAGDSLVVQPLGSDVHARVAVEHGVADGLADVPLSWSPDGRRVLFPAVPLVAGTLNTQVIDVTTGERSTMPTTGGVAFLSDTEVATWTFREHGVAIVRLGGHGAKATCDVPGDFTFVWDVVGMPDGTMVVQTRKGDTSGIVVIGHDCRVRGTFTGGSISSIAASDTGTIVALVTGDGFGDIVEVGLDGAVLSRRRVLGSPETILGRRHGIDYVSVLAMTSHLDRVHGADPLVSAFSTPGNASFTLAPDGETLAWIESGNHGYTRGRLRISTLGTLSRPGPALLDDALMAGWSPSGRLLAVLVGGPPTAPDDASAFAISLVVIDTDGKLRRRMALDHVDRESAPVWIDDHRVAIHTDDRTTYRWYDLDAGEQGKIVDSGYGSTYWLSRSPRDGTLAMWRNGPPGSVDTRPEHVWLQTFPQPARPLHIDDASRHFLMPSWTPSGDLLVRALETGVVSRVSLSSGELTPVAQLAVTPMLRSFDNHLMVLATGDLLAVDVDFGIEVAATTAAGTGGSAASSP